MEALYQLSYSPVRAANCTSPSSRVEPESPFGERGALSSPAVAATTLTARIHAAAATSRRAVTFLTGDVAVRVPWSELHREALGVAASLQARGIGPGHHVGLIGPTSRGLVTSLEAVWLAGATVVVLPLPMRMGSLDEFIDQTRARVAHADCALVIVDPDFAPFVPVEGMPPTVTYADLCDATPESFVHVEPPDDALAVLQFTSGSTSDPKGVMLPHRTVCANLDAIREAAEFDHDREVMVSWLPLYHDMGLVGFLILPMSTGVDLVLGAPQDFLGDPSRWMHWLSDYGGTATAGPNFAWVLATRALQRLTAQNVALDLSALRIALNGAEPVDCAAVERFVEAARPHRMHPGAVFPAFGMAEVVIAGTFPQPGSGLRVDRVDRRALECESRAVPTESGGARPLAFLGRAVPGLELRIVDPATKQVLGDRQVGELQIRGTSVTTGYYKRADVNDALFDDGWLHTGDLAYLVDGDMVMCGRIKDVIIVGGRNIYPDDIERSVGVLDGVRAGNVVAFGVDHQRGKEALVVVAESSSDDPELVRKLIAQRTLQVVGVPARDVVVVKPGSLPKTSSGKLQRSLCRERYVAGDLAIVP